LSVTVHIIRACFFVTDFWLYPNFLSACRYVYTRFIDVMLVTNNRIAANKRNNAHIVLMAKLVKGVRLSHFGRTSKKVNLSMSYTRDCFLGRHGPLDPWSAEVKQSTVSGGRLHAGGVVSVYMRDYPV